jgi:hypothetical protein
MIFPGVEGIGQESPHSIRLSVMSLHLAERFADALAYGLSVMPLGRVREAQPSSSC